MHVSGGVILSDNSNSAPIEFLLGIFAESSVLGITERNNCKVLLSLIHKSQDHLRLNRSARVQKFVSLNCTLRSNSRCRIKVRSARISSNAQVVGHRAELIRKSAGAKCPSSEPHFSRKERSGYNVFPRGRLDLHIRFRSQLVPRASL